MSKSFSRKFYNSPEWKKCRATYVKKEPYCEVCLQRGEVVPVEIVHHIIELTPENITNPNIALSHDNLQSVCRECHAEKHNHTDKQKRYRIMSNGEIVPISSPSPPHQ